MWERGPAVTYARFKAVLAERERRGEIRVPDRQIAAEQFIGGLVAHVQMKLAFGMTERPSKAKTERRVARAVETFMARYATDAAK